MRSNKMGDRPPPPDPVFTLRGSRNSVTSLKFPSEKLLYSGDSSGLVYTWNMTTRRIASSLSAHPGHSVLWIDTSNSDSLITQGRDGTVKIWKSTDSMAEYVLSGEVKSSDMGFCAGCLLQKDGHCLMAVPGVDQSEVNIIDTQSLKSVVKLTATDENSSAGKFGMCMTICGTQNKTTDAIHILVGYEDGSIALWDIRTGRMIDREKLHPESVMCMGFSSFLGRGFSGSADCDLVSWTFTGDEKLTLKNKVSVTNPGFSALETRHDGKIVASGGWDSKVRIFGAKKLKPLAVLSYHKESVQCLRFSPGNILACGSKDQHISLWDIYR